nr:uncharacterized protein LOC127329200 [Lolium perenne]
MQSASTTASVSPFLAALLAGTAPPPLVPPPISTRAAGSIFANGAGWPFSTLVSPLAQAPSPPSAPPPALAPSAPPLAPSPAYYTLTPAAPAPITASGVPGAAAPLPSQAASAPLVPYGAGLYGQPLFYGMPPLSYGPHSPPPPPPVVDTPPVAVPAAVPAAVPDATQTIPAAPFHFAHLLTVKLNADNYLLWRAQVLPLLRSHYLEGFVDGTLPCPSAVIQVTTADGAPMVITNPTHRLWVAQDQAILGAIQSSLTPSVAGMVVFATSSRDAWATLDSSFSSQSMARSMAIRTKLGEIKKLDSSMSTYYHKVKEMADILSSIGQPLRDEEFTSFLLNGLDEDYEALPTRPTAVVDVAPSSSRARQVGLRRSHASQPHRPAPTAPLLAAAVPGSVRAVAPRSPVNFAALRATLLLGAIDASSRTFLVLGMMAAVMRSKRLS